MSVVNQLPPNGVSAFSGYILGSFGTLVSIAPHLIFGTLTVSTDYTIPNPPSQSRPPCG